MTIELPRHLAITSHGDERGRLSVLDQPHGLSFQANRLYWMTDIPAEPDVTRGHHAHHQCDQALIAIVGGCMVHWESVDGNSGKDPLNAGGDQQVLTMPKLVWHWLTDFEPGTVIAVLASHSYDPDDYIRQMDDFRQMQEQYS